MILERSWVEGVDLEDMVDASPGAVPLVALLERTGGGFLFSPFDPGHVWLSRCESCGVRFVTVAGLGPGKQLSKDSSGNDPAALPPAAVRVGCYEAGYGHTV